MGMGLDFSHCNARWSYTGFSRFRARLAEAAGLKELNNLVIKNDPILPLLAHSDCEGILTPEECRSVAPRLRDLVSNWQDGDYDKDTGLELAEGMESAASKNEDLEFM
jgi:hypothetical protein